MNVYTIVLERLSTGEQAVSFLTRQETKEDARAYAEAAIADDLDLRIVEIRIATHDLEGPLTATAAASRPRDTRCPAAAAVVTYLCGHVDAACSNSRT